METKVFEGTLAEVQRQISDLPFAPETRVRVTVEEAKPHAAAKQRRNGIALVPVKDSALQGAEMPTAGAEPFRPTEFRNGVPLLPRRETAEPLTTEFVKRLLD